MNLNDNKVLLAISGGVDSSTSAALLLERGYDVIGVTFITLNPDKYDSTSGIKQHVYQNIEDAKKVCEELKINHYVIDLSDDFKKTVIDYFIQDYLNGRTPNPCTRCNPIIKWGKMLERANQFDAKYIATGHYSCVRFDEDLKRYVISKGTDKTKDQSYVLWGLSQEKLSRTLFPLGEWSKEKTRELAALLDLSVKDKPESQENCFILEKNYQLFLKKHIPDIDNQIGAGKILYNGAVMGEHSGYQYYTIGQRKGLGIKYKEPLYVNEIIPEKNIIKVGTESDLFHNGLVAHSVNLVKYDSIDAKKIFTVKVRYNDKGHDAICKYNGNGKMVVEFTEPLKAITPGQSVVIYEDEDLVGGAVIEKWID